MAFSLLDDNGLWADESRNDERNLFKLREKVGEIIVSLKHKCQT